MKSDHMPVIDALRGLAALYVLLFHLPNITHPSAVSPGWFWPFVVCGGSGVWLFFIISAFTLCLSTEARASHEASPIRNFYLRRFFRIAPLFYIWMIIYYFRDIWYYNDVHPFSEVAPSLFFLMNLIPGQEQGYVWASWTIGTEMLFYLCFPVIFRLANSLSKAFLLFCLCLLIRLPWHAVILQFVIDPQEAENFYEYSLLFNLATFMFGIVIFRAYKLIDIPFFARIRAGAMLVAIFWCGFLSIAYGRLGYSRTDYVTLQTLLYGILLLGLIINPFSLMVNSVTKFFGKISYSIYLSHATILFFMSPIFAELYGHIKYRTAAFGASLLLAIIVITPISYLTYRYVEHPGNVLGRRVIQRFSRETADDLRCLR